MKKCCPDVKKKRPASIAKCVGECPKCNKGFTTTSGRTLHMKRCCPDMMAQKIKQQLPKASEYTGPYAEGDPYARIVYKPFAKGGLCQERSPHQPKGVWYIDIESFHEALKVIDPKQYFITSGEAVKKTEVLCTDLKAALQIATRLLTIFKTLKADAKYLETQWENQRLLIKTKNPRPSSRISQRAIENEQKRRKAKSKKSRK
jgi:hypothetical protein